MARASIVTLLSLDRFARLMGISPAHFNQGYSPTIMPLSEGCSDVWYQYAWQSNDRVSREEVAEAISTAEQDIARALGWWPAPVWMAEEVQPYPRFHRPEMLSYGMMGADGLGKGVRTSYGKLIAPGQRESDLILAAVVPVWSDADGDGVNDTATVTAATTLTNVQSIKCYFAGHSGAPEWEIRDPRTKRIAGGNVLFTFWPWQLIKPELWEALTSASGAPAEVDVTVGANLVATVDVYREFNDTGAQSAQLYWEPSCETSQCCCGGAGCSACNLTTQDGCLHIKDAEHGLVSVAAAEYDAADDAWGTATPLVCRDPDFVKLWYRSGNIEQGYLSGSSHDPLSHWWAQTIAGLAAARLEKPVCSCPNVSLHVGTLQTDLALMGGTYSYNVGMGLLDNPFGTRKGEVDAWRRIQAFAPKRAKVAVI